MKRTHPVYLLTQLPRFFWLLLLPLVRGLAQWQGGSAPGKAPLLLAVLLIFTAAFLRWQTRRWALQEAFLLVSHGVFLRRQFRIPFCQIAAVRESRGLLLRLFGARRLQIETAAGNAASKGLTILLGNRDAQTFLTAYAGEMLAPRCRMGAGETLLASLSTSNFALGLFAAAPILRGAGKLFGALVQDRLRHVLTSAQRLAAAYVPPILTAIALLAFLGWALHVLKLLENYHRFTLYPCRAGLAAQSGLIVKRRFFIRTAGISAYFARQTPLLFFIRRVQIGALYAGRTGGRGEEAILMPLFRARGAADLIQSLGGFCPEVVVHTPLKEGWRAYLPAFVQICALACAAAYAVFFTKMPPRTIFFISAAALPLLLLFYFPARRRQLREGASPDFYGIRAIKGFSEWSLFFLPGALRGMRISQTPGQAEGRVCTVRALFRTTRQERYSLHNFPLRLIPASHKDELNQHHIQGGSGADA